MTMDENTNDTIKEIMDVLQGGEFDSKRQLEDLTAKLEEVFAPAIALEDLRYEQIGEMLYKFTWDSRAANDKNTVGKSGSLPILRFDNERLEKFLLVLERQGVLSSIILTDPLWEMFDAKTERHIHRALSSLNKTDLEHEKAICIKVLAKLLGDATSDGLLNNSLPVMISAPAFNLVMQNTRMEPWPAVDWRAGSRRVIDYRTLGQKFLESRIDESNDSNYEYPQLLSIISALAFYSEDPQSPRVSQKARGIQTLSENPYGNTWITKPSIPVALDTALNVSEAELSASISTLWGPHYMEKFWKDGCFIRTCPEDPRAGALENSHTFNLEDACKDLRGLASVMLDKTKPDYDPNGELVIMKFERPSCSGVAVKGHRHISVGPIHDGATNTRGTLIHLYLSNDGAYNITKAVNGLRMADGMAYHEIEFVWGEDDGPKADFQHIRNRLSVSRYTESHSPTCTQVRGLRMDKEPLFPPAVVDGEVLHIRGAVPEHGHGDDSEGKVIQKTYIDVEKGDLSDCMELEQMAKKGTLPEGLVVYASAGGPMCHAAGVSREWGFPIVYGQQPYDNGTLWTEVQGWVCCNYEDVEAKPYDPTLVTEYFHIGMDDGDKFWDYGNVALSSFLHTYMSSGVNDPRFEAYLGGIYSMWLVKATLATSLGEMRHAYDGKASLTSHISLRHLLSIMSLAEDNDITEFNWDSRASYYSLLKNKQIGLPYLHTMLKNCKACFDESEWSGSFGGMKYMQSVHAALECCSFMMAFGEGDVDVNKVLGKVNKLENAVHNTGGFFNKFVRNKYWFDMATNGGHTNLDTVAWQYHVAAVFHTRFYRRIVEEPWVCYEGYKSTHESLLDEYHVEIMEDSDIKKFTLLMGKLCSFAKIPLYEAEEYYSSSEMECIRDVIAAYCQSKTAYCEDCDSTECGCYAPHTKRYHKQGMCGIAGCPNGDCQEIVFATQYGLKQYQLETIFSLLRLNSDGPNIPLSYKGVLSADQPRYLIRGGFNALHMDYHKVKMALTMTKEGIESMTEQDLRKLMSLGPLGAYQGGDYHPDSNVWVEPTREVAEDSVIDVQLQSVDDPASALTTDLPPILMGSLADNTNRYVWLDASTHEFVRRVYAIWDDYYGIKRDSLYEALEDLEAEKEILRDIMLGGHSGQANIITSVDDGLVRFQSAVKDKLQLTGYSGNIIVTSNYDHTSTGVFDSSQTFKGEVNVALQSKPESHLRWLNTAIVQDDGSYYYSTNSKGVYFTLLLDYFHYLHHECYKILHLTSDSGTFANTFIPRYGVEFVKEMLELKENGNNE